MTAQPAQDGGIIAPLSEEDHLRAQFYALLSRFLAAPPDDATLDSVRGLDGDDTPIGQALRTLGAVAARMPRAKAEEEFSTLFYGFGAGGEVMPYASRYKTGFLYERPLAELRKDLAALGVARDDDTTREPEDHIAFLCEVMHGLITGSFGTPVDHAGQKAFFDAHIAAWAGAFFKDLEEATSATLYMPIGLLGRLFIEVEAEAFEMGSEG